MRDLLLSLEAQSHTNYHAGYGLNITQRNLIKANQKRSYKIYEDFTIILIEETRIRCYKIQLQRCQRII